LLGIAGDVKYLVDEMRMRAEAHNILGRTLFCPEEKRKDLFYSLLNARGYQRWQEI